MSIAFARHFVELVLSRWQETSNKVVRWPSTAMHSAHSALKLHPLSAIFVSKITRYHSIAWWLGRTATANFKTFKTSKIKFFQLLKMFSFSHFAVFSCFFLLFFIFSQSAAKLHHWSGQATHPALWAPGHNIFKLRREAPTGGKKKVLPNKIKDSWLLQDLPSILSVDQAQHESCTLRWQKHLCFMVKCKDR